MPIEEFEDFSCPYCGGINTLQIDMSAGSNQEFVVDCEVCCAPIVILLRIRNGEILSFEAKPENE